MGVLSKNAVGFYGFYLSANQIEQARILSKDMDIKYYSQSTEDTEFPDHSFDVITACQCFWYFNHQQVMPKFLSMLKPDERILVLYMAWLPFEDEITGASEKLVLKYSPAWSGAGETMHPIVIPDCYKENFELVYHEEYPLRVHFTRESWNGRMKACRGIGASLTEQEISLWEQEHRKLLAEFAPAEFDVLHYGAIAELKVLK